MNRRTSLVAVATLWLGGIGRGWAQWMRPEPASGLGQHLRKQVFSAGQRPLRSIEVMEAVQQQSLMVLPRHLVVQASGTTGVLATSYPGQAGNQLREASEKLAEGFKRNNTSLAKEFTALLVHALRARNMESRVGPGRAPSKNALGSRMAWDAADGSWDAMLYTVLRFAGYKEEDSGLVPMVGIDAYLFDARTGDLLYRQVFNQGFALVSGRDVESLPYAAVARIANRAELLAGPERAMKGLVQAVAPVAARIAEQITP